MKQRQRKLLGILACVTFMTIYCLIAMAIGGEYAVDTHPLTQFAYFILAGIAWLPPVMLIIRWASRPD